MRANPIHKLVLLLAVAGFAFAQAPSGEPTSEPDLSTAPPEVDLNVFPQDVDARETGPRDPTDAGQTSAETGSDVSLSAPDPLIDGLNQELDRRQGAQEESEGPAFTADRPAPRGFMYYLQVIASLAFVLALVILTGYVLRRFGKTAPFLGGAAPGDVIGKVHLARGATLYFVRTGGKVLVIGATTSALNPVAEFDAGAFEHTSDTEREAPRDFGPENFLAQLRENDAAMKYRGVSSEEEDEIASLRGDIQRLQRYLQEESRGPRE